jgi:UDP-4-amino-4,6-dideoxy-N-acetyl-beta-L-altrosamine transaminase
MSSDELPFLSYGRQSISEDDIAAVEAVLRSDWLTQGPANLLFESALAELTGAAHVIATANATAALHIACLALDVGVGDRVWTSPNSFVASANCARYCGADVDFVDIDPVTLNMSIEALAEKLALSDRAGRLPKVVIPVHFAGQSCDMAAIGALADRYGFRVIEDASHAVGGKATDAMIGACAHSDVTVFSFHPVKIVTTGEGGAALTQNSELARRLALLSSHGVSRSDAEMEGPSEGPWYYQQVELGFNYRMTDIQAALGASQLKRIATFIARRHDIADHYDAQLASLPLTTPCRTKADYSALHLYPIQLHDASRRESVFKGLRAARIGVNVHYIPIHLQPYYRRLGFNPGDFPAAEDYYSRAISLPMHPRMEAGDVDRVVAALKELLD